jgi:hypothetical protein
LAPQTRAAAAARKSLEAANALDANATTEAKVKCTVFEVLNQILSSSGRLDVFINS